MNLKARVQGQKLTLTKINTTASESINYFAADFDFSEDWAGKTIWAHFWNKSGSVLDVQLTDGKIPPTAGVSLSAGLWWMWLHGNSYEGGQLVQRVTTTKECFRVQETGALGGQPFSPVAPSVVEQLEAEIAGKQDEIEDLEDIRAGAEAGSTAVQPDDLGTMAAEDDAPVDNKQYARKNGEWVEVTGGGGGSSDYNDLTNKPEVNSVELTGNKSLHDLGAAAEDHNHDGVYSPVGHNHDGTYSPVDHDHDSRYYTQTETDSKLAGKADQMHEHLFSQIFDQAGGMRQSLTSALAGKSNTGHNHDDRYAPIDTGNYPITCTESGGTKSFDKTYQQIAAAISLGLYPIVNYDGRKYYYGNNKFSKLWFYSAETNQNKVYNLNIDSDNAVAAGTLTTVAQGHGHTQSDVTGLTAALAGKEAIANKVTSLSAASTDTEYPSAKCVYDIIGDVESLLEALL